MVRIHPKPSALVFAFSHVFFNRTRSYMFFRKISNLERFKGETLFFRIVYSVMILNSKYILNIFGLMNDFLASCDVCQMSCHDL